MRQNADQNNSEYGHFTQRSGQEERQRPGNLLKKAFDKKNLTPSTKLSSPKYSRHWLYHKQV